MLGTFNSTISCRIRTLRPKTVPVRTSCANFAINGAIVGSKSRSRSISTKMNTSLYGAFYTGNITNTNYYFSFNKCGYSASAARRSKILPTKTLNFEFETVTEMQERACAFYKERPSLGTKKGGGAFEYITYTDLNLLVAAYRTVLHTKYGISSGDKVGLISNNRLEWAVSYWSVLSLGAQIVPMYEAQLMKDWTYILDHSDSKLVLVANESIHNKLKEFKNGKVNHLVNFESDDFKKDVEKFRSINAQTVKSFPVKPLDDAAIIYTSGTTGLPKGVVLSHDNIVSNLKGLYQIRGNDNVQGQVALSFLPWAHIFGQTAELNALVSTGSAIAIVPRREEILECITLVKPTMILSVPLFINKIYDAIHKKVSLRPKFVQKLLTEALRVARVVNSAKEMDRTPGFIYPILYNIYDKVVFKKIREGLGGRLKFMGSGGAALSLPVLQFFEDINIPIVEGYGLTETSPVVSSSTVVGPGAGQEGVGKSLWSTKRLGCLGVPLPNVSVRIIDPESLQERPSGEIGEISVSGPSIMTKYYKNSDATDAAFYTASDGERYFRTGDLGLMVDNKFLKLAGRIKEQYKLENGKFVGPTPLEDLIITTSELIFSQCFLFGENRKFNVLLVVPEPTEFKKWCESKGFDPSISSFDLKGDVNGHESIIKLFSEVINKSCENMKAYEKPKKFHVLDPFTEAFTQENQLLTPKMSLRRNNIVKTHAELINEIYDNKKGHNL